MAKESFVAVRRNNDGDLVAFKSTTGAEYDYETAKELCSQGLIENAETFVGKGHHTYIRGKVDGNEGNNLSNLPTF
ncbi:MAG TPA: DUF3892 domain-containing protein [Firmicutes bacterium]|nr:DUF3892 domain-containing protein [Bacillota bacterium]